MQIASSQVAATPAPGSALQQLLDHVAPNAADTQTLLLQKIADINNAQATIKRIQAFIAA